jgi:F-type H+-transporting ATPase subunit b
MGLGINLSLLLSQLINFAAVFLMLYFWAYKPILRIFAERSRRTEEGLRASEEANELKAKMEEERSKRLAIADKEGQEIISRAIETADDIKQKAEEEAKKSATSLVDRAKAEIEKERLDTLNELRKEFANLVIEATGKVIEASLDREAHMKLINKVIEQSSIFRNSQQTRDDK